MVLSFEAFLCIWEAFRLSLPILTYPCVQTLRLFYYGTPIEIKASCLVSWHRRHRFGPSNLRLPWC
jgi:hypothetical protein